MKQGQIKRLTLTNKVCVFLSYCYKVNSNNDSFQMCTVLINDKNKTKLTTVYRISLNDII